MLADRPAFGIVQEDVQEKEKKRRQCHRGSARGFVSCALKPSCSYPPADPEVNARQRLVNAFKSVCERAADLVKNGVTSTGKAHSTAIFVYENEADNLEASTTKTIALIWRSELQKEAPIRRIREKACMEHAFAVLTLTEAEPESGTSLQRQGALLLSGVTPGMNLSARVDYAFDTETKSITSWELHWLERPVQNVFLDGIFPVGRGSV